MGQDRLNSIDKGSMGMSFPLNNKSSEGDIVRLGSSIQSWLGLEETVKLNSFSHSTPSSDFTLSTSSSSYELSLSYSWGSAPLSIVLWP
ncbi:hypothetical protein GBA52_009262 [Prunus armeniaca]|nr:hypothetical protein GBA52_009262 [Prunus armeniaca]